MTLTRRAWFWMVAGVLTGASAARRAARLQAGNLHAFLESEGLITRAGIGKATFPFWRNRRPTTPCSPELLKDLLNDVWQRCEPGGRIVMR